ncbi:MAG TPA: alpha/beta fold hydrolase, partial [Burkholderiales bacterium]|nr:alpha/beta fold hydrolase [Burkholderiales bacterium]
MSAEQVEPRSREGSIGPLQKNDVRDVVFLHGWGQDAGVWDDLAARLAPRFRAHAPDLPGYGAAAGRSPCTLEAMAEAVAHGAPRRCHVVGWSLGGQVALLWARRAPHQVERLALIATTPCFTQRPGWSCALAAEEVRDFARALAADRAGTLARFAALQA